MKTFNDLVFEPHPVGDGLMARMNFDNDYGVSVIRFRIGGTWGSYTSNDNDWEVAVLYKDTLCYTSGITEDVLGHLSESEVTDIMKRVQELTN